MTARYIVADVYDGIRSLPDNSVDLVFTSPPFLALRSYLPADHPDKAKELGSEPTPAAFIDSMLDVVEALAPKLTEHASICFEFGDTFAGSGGAGGDYNDGGLRDGQNAFDGSARRTRTLGSREHRPEGASHRSINDFEPMAVPLNGGPGWPLAKSLCLIPESFRWALAYGRNPFNGRETERWRVRNVVRWCRPNPPVGALGDKFRPGTSEIVVACKSAKRWFDLDAVRQPFSDVTIRQSQKPSVRDGRNNGPKADGADESENNRREQWALTTAGAPPLDWWEIPTEPYKGSHYATFPRRLVDRPILSMCPRRVCRTCGEPSRRITSTEQADTGRKTNGSKPRDRAESFAGTTYEKRTEAVVETLGWTDCGHNDFRHGVVLDPFAGSGTTLAVAVAHGRDAIGIELDSRNVPLAEQRVGMFLTVEYLDARTETDRPDDSLLAQSAEGGA